MLSSATNTFTKLPYANSCTNRSMHIVQYKSEQVILELFHSDNSFVIGEVYINMCTIVAHSNYLQLWFKENVCLNELTIGSSALFILTEGHRLSDAYPSFRAKGRINPPRQRSTCTQIPNCRASAAISYIPPIHPSVVLHNKNIFCTQLSMFPKLHFWIEHIQIKITV